jgi:hypothetical protein
MGDNNKAQWPGANIEFMEYDYLTPQPIKDAEVYFYRFVFHNLPDDKAIGVLRAAIPALKKGARILINDENLSQPGEARWFNERACR